MAETASAPVLDLQTLIETSHVRIDGALYPLRTIDAMSLGEVKRLQRDSPRIAALLQQDDLTEDEATEVSHLVASTCRIVLNAPPDVHARLGDQQRVAILEAFMTLRPGATTEPPTGARAALRSTGPTGFRGSSGSMAATRRAGSRASR